MINVTLTFSGVPELLEFFTSIGAPATAVKVETAPTPKPKRAAPAPAPAAETEAAPAQPTATPTEAPAPAVAPAPAPEPAPEPIINYADLQKAVLALYTKDRSKAAGIATDMGFASFKVMPAERWAEALAKVNAALEA